ncbi:hypothetical protein RND71_008078 [Anisodus tanguticus]|uniref:Uncharacterized protein n=1 Tax=Anisodus tanguticus TaxID=243964 RepID=A0AAE1SN08_9SOLA|nr:hypothetical protein RND71_008008 [Anisodus tanguticus]KAK4372694.1 hypothetical protein RND71_008078 [Anisodus tanguticus]
MHKSPPPHQKVKNPWCLLVTQHIGLAFRDYYEIDGGLNSSGTGRTTSLSEKREIKDERILPLF